MVISDLKTACAGIAQRATNVQIQLELITAYASLLPAPVPQAAVSCLTGARREREAAFWMTLDAINFGSGWFPTLRKRHEPTGYRTIAAGVRRRFEEVGAWSPWELEHVTAQELALTLDQAPEHELMALFASSLQDLGRRVRVGYGSFSGLIDAAGGSALILVETLATWECFRDVSVYDGVAVPFLKRAQIAAADLSRTGAATFADLNQLTLFADNLVPHVLRLDGLLRFEPELVARIDRGELILHDSREEIEIRACALHAVELIAAIGRARGGGPTAAQIDQILWNRGQGPAYKAVPRHRSRSTAY